MGKSLGIYLGIWFGMLLIGLAGLYLAAGSPSMLSSSVKAQYEESCTTGGGGDSSFFDNEGSDAECYDAAERALAIEADNAQSNILSWFASATVPTLLLGLIFTLQVVLAESKASTPSQFAALRPAWWQYFVVISVSCIIFAILAHFTQAFDAWGAKLGAGRAWGIPIALIILSWLGFWAGTKFATPEKMQPSVPG